LIQTKVQINYKGWITELDRDRHDSAILGNWPHAEGSIILAIGPRTYVGKLAHLCRVYRIMACYSLFRERNCERHVEWNYAKVLTTRED
jgi:hypothetical protein